MANAQVVPTTGRRKSATARVFLKKDGKGQFLVNGKPLKTYLGRETDVMKACLPFSACGLNMEDYSVNATTKGGGPTGQAGAISLGIARSLKHLSDNFKGMLRVAGLLTRDDREVERKKVGKPGARRSKQFSKR